ncbi:MAG: hypothetical protein V4713_12305 [Pseudomonadota bacterium]
METSLHSSNQNASYQRSGQAPTVVMALKSALEQGSAERVSALLKAMNAQTMAAALRGVGFEVDAALVSQGRNAIFADVRPSIQTALARKVDGFALSGKSRPSGAMQDGPFTFAAKAEPYTTMDFDAANFKGDLAAAKAVQSVFQSSSLRVDMLGDAPHTERDALLMIAGQGMKRGILGFGFDGIPGKFEVSLPMSEVVQLHAAASQAVAVESAKAGLQAWSAGDRALRLSEWIPDSTQRLLQGVLSLDSAKAIVHTIESGTISKHAKEIGTHIITKLLVDKGLDVNAPTVEMQAAAMEFKVEQPDRQCGRYFGTVVAQDHRASLIKTTRTSAIVVPFSEMPAGQERPAPRSAIRIEFQQGNMNITQSGRTGREGTAR